MSSQGPLYPSAAVVDTSVGVYTWTNPQYIKAADSNYAFSGFFNLDSYTQYLRATDFGFSLPSIATIDGIVVTVNRRNGANGSIYDENIRLVLADGTIGTTNKKSVDLWPKSSFATQSYGGSTDTWGETLTGADVNNVLFGFVISAKMDGFTHGSMEADVEYVRMTVYYTSPTVISVSDNITSTESVTAKATPDLSIYSAGSLSEDISSEISSDVSVYETASLNESITFSNDLNIEILDEPITSESFVAIAGEGIYAYEDVTRGEEVTLRTTTDLVINDIMTSSESFTGIPDPSISVFDSQALDEDIDVFHIANLVINVYDEQSASEYFVTTSTIRDDSWMSKNGSVGELTNIYPGI